MPINRLPRKATQALSQPPAPKPIPDVDKATVTETGKYIIPGTKNDSSKPAKKLYSREDATPPREMNPAGNDVFEHGGSRYREYGPGRKVMPDCLHTAEEFMHGNKLAAGEVRSQEKLTGKAFGVSDNANQKVAQQAKRKHPDAVNTNASPDVGEAYAIVRQKKPKVGESPYHAAAVVAKDGRHTVTLETSATNVDATRYNKKPEVFVQEVGSSTNSFHKIMSDTYGKDAITVPLKKKEG